MCSYSFPRVREYFHTGDAGLSADRLFPARAGVFPTAGEKTTRLVTLSRACGSISFSKLPGRTYDTSFPRVREYFLFSPNVWFSAVLFPARAGVFPPRYLESIAMAALSRACGSISQHGEETTAKCTSFPRVREYFPNSST